MAAPEVAAVVPTHLAADLDANVQLDMAVNERMRMRMRMRMPTWTCLRVKLKLFSVSHNGVEEPIAARVTRGYYDSFYYIFIIMES